MALTGTDRGAGSRNTGSENTYAITPGSNLAAGSLAVLFVAYDNTGASGADPYSAISDSKGNVWTSRQNSLNDPGAASAGIAMRCFTAFLVAPLTTSDTITVSFGGTTTVARAFALHEVTSSLGFAEYVSGGQNAVTGTAQTITTSSINNGEMVLGATGGEWGTTQTFTPDADATNGAWSTHQTSSVGTTTSGAGISSQRKVVNATATQTYNVTLGLSADSCVIWISVKETIPALVPIIQRHLASRR